MKSLSKVFIRVFATTFYQVNAGFFFICAGICFGFLSGREHKALAQAFVSSPALLLIPFCIWILYGLKIIAFNSITLSRPENTFLFSVSILPRIQLWQHISMIAISQLAPIIAYGVFLIMMAVHEKQFDSVFEIIAILMLITVFISWKLIAQLRHPNTGSKVSLMKSKLDALITKPFIWFYPEWIFRLQPVMVVGVKVFSCLIIVGVSRFYLFDTYDERLLAMGCVLAFTSNLVLVFYYHRFENFHFTVLRSLPLSLTRRALSFLITFFILNIFEWGVLLNAFPAALSFIHLPLLVLFALSVYFVSYSFLFIKDLSQELFLQKAGIAAFVWIVLILFKVPVFVFIVIHFLAGSFIYRSNFYRFEFNAEINSDK